MISKRQKARYAEQLRYSGLMVSNLFHEFSANSSKFSEHNFFAKIDCSDFFLQNLSVLYTENS